MLERIALHQTRLRTPGLSLDAKGVALGSRGWVVVGSMERLVGFLAAYTRERSLEELLPSLAMHVLRSGIGARVLGFEFAAESSERMDRVAEAAVLVGGLTFTGTVRHFVRYRDAAAPFGYDATQLLGSAGALAFYGEQDSQTYDVERPIDLRSLLLGLVPRRAGQSPPDTGPRLVVAEPGLGPALVQYLVRWGVAGEVAVVEWPPPSFLDDAPVRRWVIRMPEMPPRMSGLLRTTPGIRTFVPAAPGVAVEVGYRHPVELRACPVFDPAALVLLRGRGDEPWVIDKLPLFGDLASFGRLELLASTEPLAAAPVDAIATSIRVPLRLLPTVRPWSRVTATWIAPDQLPLLRMLAYALSRAIVARTRAARTDRGVLLRCPSGIDAIPIGTFLVEMAPQVLTPAGYELVPAASPETFAHALGASTSRVVFLDVEGRAFQLDESAFVPLGALLLDAPAPLALAGDPVAQLLDETAIELTLGGPPRATP